METGWVPKKLGIYSFCLQFVLMSLLYTYIYHIEIFACLVDVYVDVDDVIDISHMRSKGLQPGEELLPEEGMACYICTIRIRLATCDYLPKALY